MIIRIFVILLHPELQAAGSFHSLTFLSHTEIRAKAHPVWVHCALAELPFGSTLTAEPLTAGRVSGKVLLITVV